MPETLGPGQRILERVDKVEYDPRYDDVVVEADVDNHKHGCDADSREVGQEPVPDEHGAFPDTLAQQQLQVEEGNTQEEEHHHVGDHEGTWEGWEGNGERGEGEGGGGGGREGGGRGEREGGREGEGERGEGREREGRGREL